MTTRGSTWLRTFCHSEECEYIKEYGRPLLKPALTIDAKTGEYVETKKDRTNSQGYAHPDVILGDPVMRNIVLKIMNL